MDVLYTLLLAEKSNMGRGPGRGLLQIGPGRRAGGFLWFLKMVKNHLLRPVKPGSLLRPVKLHKNGCMCFSTGLNKEPVLTGLTRNQA